MTTAQDVERAWAELAGEPELGLLLARRFLWNPPGRYIVNLGKDRFLGPPRYDVAAGTLDRILRVLDEVAPGAEAVFREFGAYAASLHAGACGCRVKPSMLVMAEGDGAQHPQEDAVLAAHALGGVKAVFGLMNSHFGVRS